MPVFYAQGLRSISLQLVLRAVRDIGQVRLTVHERQMYTGALKFASFLRAGILRGRGVGWVRMGTIAWERSRVMYPAIVYYICCVMLVYSDFN